MEPCFQWWQAPPIHTFCIGGNQSKTSFHPLSKTVTNSLTPESGLKDCVLDQATPNGPPQFWHMAPLIMRCVSTNSLTSQHGWSETWCNYSQSGTQSHGTPGHAEYNKRCMEMACRVHPPCCWHPNYWCCHGGHFSGWQMDFQGTPMWCLEGPLLLLTGTLKNESLRSTPSHCEGYCTFHTWCYSCNTNQKYSPQWHLPLAPDITCHSTNNPTGFTPSLEVYITHALHILDMIPLCTLCSISFTITFLLDYPTLHSSYNALSRFNIQWLKKLIHKRSLFPLEAGCTSGNKAKPMWYYRNKAYHLGLVRALYWTFSLCYWIDIDFAMRHTWWISFCADTKFSQIMR